MISSYGISASPRPPSTLTEKYRWIHICNPSITAPTIRSYRSSIWSTWSSDRALFDDEEADLLFFPSSLGFGELLSFLLLCRANKASCRIVGRPYDRIRWAYNQMPLLNESSCSCISGVRFPVGFGGNNDWQRVVAAVRTSCADGSAWAQNIIPNSSGCCSVVRVFQAFGTRECTCCKHAMAATRTDEFVS